MIIRAKSSARYQYQSFSLFLCIHGRRAASEGIAGEAADVGQVQSLEDEQLQAYMQDDQPMLTAVQAAATTYQVGKKSTSIELTAMIHMEKHMSASELGNTAMCGWMRP